jgi:hypothetical protein
MKFNPEEYDQVKVRIQKFYAEHPDGCIMTEIYTLTANDVIFKATVIIDGKVKSTGFAQEVKGQGYVNKTSHVENCETSAIGRALANMGLHGDKRASLEEMQKVERTEKEIELQFKNCKVELQNAKDMEELDKVSFDYKNVKSQFSDEQSKELKEIYKTKKEALNG